MDERTFEGLRAAFGLSRRGLLVGAAAGAAGLALPGRRAALAAADGPFRHGVASGDPLADRVVLWTRVTTTAPRSTPVRWQVASDPAMTRLVRQGVTLTSAARDWTVKVDVTGLRPGTPYWYRFIHGGTASPVGRTLTLPVGTAPRLKLAVFSCSNFEGGFFNAYREAAGIADLDLVLHLGDYIYEYANGLETPATARDPDLIPRLDQLVPRKEIVSLADYRTRHALYKTDPDLQALHAHCPWLTVWDDHESTNDAWTGGAENHNPGEGPWQRRKARSVQAYYEWMPIREPADGMPIDPVTGNPDDLYRSFDVGDLARIVMLDTRQAGRDRQLDTGSLIEVYSGTRPDTTPDGRPRSMLGAAQEAWLLDRLRASTQTWQLLGNQILAFYQNAPDIDGTTALTATEKATARFLLDQIGGPGTASALQQLADVGGPTPLTGADAWTGYPTARASLLGILAQARNPVILTGDSHNAWTANLKAPTPVGLLPIAVEFGGTSVSSPGFEQFLLGIAPASIAALLVDSSQRLSPTDKLIFSEASRRGFLLVDVTPARVRAEHVLIDSVFATSWTTTRTAFEVLPGTRTAAQVGV